jgi:hypothetical protein
MERPHHQFFLNLGKNTVSYGRGLDIMAYLLLTCQIALAVIFLVAATGKLL